jgi:hypothetical protein
MGKCAYCDENRKLTREHVWSDSILEIFQSVAPKTFDFNREIVHEGDPMLKDTCGECNSDLSDTDAFAMRLVGESLRSGPPLGVRLPLNDDRLWRWVFKTTFNLPRFSKQPLAWALPLRSYLTGKTARPVNLSLFFAAWDDSSPGGVALNLNIVHWLDARHPQFDMLDSVTDAEIRSQATMATVIKPGFGVFLPMVWQQVNAPAHSILRTELMSHGWLDCVSEGTAQRVPFDMFSSGQFEILVPSRKHVAFIDSRKAALAGEAVAFKEDHEKQDSA